MYTRIYGASDDLIEIEGELNDEHDCYDHKSPIKISASDGTEATIFYNGIWEINIKTEGKKFIEKIQNVGDDGKHIGNAMNCSSYSDVLVLNENIEWIKIGRKMFKRN